MFASNGLMYCAGVNTPRQSKLVPFAVVKTLGGSLSQKRNLFEGQCAAFMVKDVFEVLASGSVAKVTQTVVGWIAIAVQNLIPLGPWAHKSLKHKLVYKTVVPSTYGY
jgi:hypothetical protein